MAFQYIALESVLSDGQIYVAEAARSLGLDVGAVAHERATSTCFEKAQILGWEPVRVVKAVYFSKGEDMRGFVFPELGVEKPRYISAQEISHALGITKSQAKGYRNGLCPEGMEGGTCTPFVEEGSFDARLESLTVHSLPGLDEQIVDISVGGIGTLAHRISLHLPYKAIFQILQYRFGDSRIKQVDLWPEA